MKVASEFMCVALRSPNTDTNVNFIIFNVYSKVNSTFDNRRWFFLSVRRVVYYDIKKLYVVCMKLVTSFQRKISEMAHGSKLKLIGVNT